MSGELLRSSPESTNSTMRSGGRNWEEEADLLLHSFGVRFLRSAGSWDHKEDDGAVARSGSVEVGWTTMMSRRRRSGLQSSRRCFGVNTARKEMGSTGMDSALLGGHRRQGEKGRPWLNRGGDGCRLHGRQRSWR